MHGAIIDYSAMAQFTQKLEEWGLAEYIDNFVGK